MGAADWDDERRRAGRALAQRLRALRDEAPIVVGLPRGGVPAAYEVARTLDAPLDVCVVAKVTARRGITIGAVGEGGALYVDEALARKQRIGANVLTRLLRARRAVVEERVRLFRSDDFARAADPSDRTVVVVDDVIVSGASARVALQILRARGAKRLVLAAPIANAAAIARLQPLADDVVCLYETAKAIRLDGVYVTRTSAGEVENDDVIELVSRVRTAQRQHYSEVWSPWQ